ncbi:MAG: c-type cytochrome [Myxococcales bacterium]|nr:c-type cytochrome [Myxococcales bacterium]
MKRTTAFFVALVVLALALLTGACDSLGDAPPHVDQLLVIPTDERPAVSAPEVARPISGGTLAVTADGRFAVATDPERDRISLVDLQTRDVREIALTAGDEPGRVVVDPEGRAHVALRSGGALVTLDVAAGEVLARRDVCSAPRGLAYASATGQLRLACTDGQVLTLDPSGGAVLERLQLDEDLRDVVPRGEGFLVSRFKAAEFLTVDAQGQVQKRTGMPSGLVASSRFDPETGSTEFRELTFEPDVAWRMVATEDGDVVVLHQQGSTEEIDIDHDPQDPKGMTGQGFGPVVSTSAYGGSSVAGSGLPECAGIVRTAVTRIDGEGRGASMVTLPGVVLAVDMAMSPDGNRVAVAQAGLKDPEANRPFVLTENGRFDEDDQQFAAFGPREGGVLIATTGFDFSQSEIQAEECPQPQRLDVGAPATAVAFTSEGQLLVQTREPAQLFVVDNRFGGFEVGSPIDLGGRSVADTGHELFHRNSGGGIACASCHAEGGDDGRTWRFTRIGERRTQAIHVGLEGTAPFHWDGDMSDLSMLMEEVFVGRMGGVPQSPERLDTLSEWLFAQRPPPAMVAADDPAAMNGKRIFESEEVGCASCHAGAALTDAESYFVGTTAGEHPLQVPSLRGIAYRAPFIHDGCAETLHDRFDPACGGGDLHGKTSHLQPEEIDDLVAYLKSL